MYIGLGLSQILAMMKRKIGDLPGEIPSPGPVPVPNPGPAPDVAIPGILDAAEIVVMGSSLTDAAFGSTETGSPIAAYAAQAGFAGRIRVLGEGGADQAAAQRTLRGAQAESRASASHNLYLMQADLEQVSALRPMRGGAETLAAAYRDLVAEAASQDDKVIPVPLTKVLYGRGAPGYPNNPHDVVPGNPASEAFGTRPFNDQIVRPVIEARAPGWASQHLTSGELAARLKLTVDRPSVVAGEAVYLRIEGLTDEEAGTWGFIWEFDTAGEFQYIPDLPWHMRQKNRATGHQQTAAWDAPGTKTVKVRVVPPLWSGKKGTVLDVEVENRDPDDFFGPRYTWVVAEDGDFTGAPDGHHVTSHRLGIRGWRTERQGRILYKRGETYDFEGGNTDLAGPLTRDYAGGIMLGAWGDKTRPKPVFDTRGCGFNWSRPERPDFVLIDNLHFEGGFDATSGNVGKSNDAWRIYENSRWTFNDCSFSNVKAAIRSINTGNVTAGNQIALYDCHIKGWEDYGLYIEKAGSTLIRGCYICQDPDAVIGSEAKNTSGQGANYADHGSCRISHAKNTVFSQIQGFVNNGWSQGSPANDNLETLKAHQPILRFGSSTADGCNALVNEVWAEGAAGLNFGAGASGGISGAGLIAVHGNYLLFTPHDSGVAFSHSGVWFHDNILVVPNALREGKNTLKLIEFGMSSGGPTRTWHTKKFEVFNNTIAFMLSNKNHPSHPPAAESVLPSSARFGPNGAQTDYVSKNNVLWAPNFAFRNESAARPSDGVRSVGTFGAAPMYRGKHQEMGDGRIVFKPEYATPEDAAILPVLSENSAFRGTADLSLAGALDFFGRVRCAAPSMGGVEIDVSDVLEPLVHPYGLADRYPKLLGETESYGLSLGRYLLARVAAGALGLERGASRAGKALLYNLGEGHPDGMTIGRSNRLLSLTDYTGFPLLCGATFLEGGFDPFVEVDVEPGFDTGVTYDGTFAHVRIADPRFHRADAINGGLAIGAGKTHRLHFAGLTPGDRMTLSCVGITTAKGPRRGDVTLTAGRERAEQVLDAGSAAESNMAVFDAVTVPGTGRISIAITPKDGSETAYLGAVLLDFA